MIRIFDQEYAVKMYGLAQWKKGFAEGYAKGFAEMVAEGENMAAALFLKLITLGRQDDLMKALSNTDYRKKLYKEFEISCSQP